MAIAIGQNKDIKGISIGSEETKTLQYADDTTAILADTSSATALFRLLDDFTILSGLKINCFKTEAMWIGSSRICKAQPFRIKWPNEPIKALGIYYTYDQKLLLEKNFIERLDSTKTVYYKSYFEAGVVHISDLSFDLNNKRLLFPSF